MGTLCKVLLSVYSATRLPIFIEIVSYLTDTEQNISWHVNFWDMVYNWEMSIWRYLLYDNKDISYHNTQRQTHLYTVQMYTTFG